MKSAFLLCYTILYMSFWNAGYARDPFSGIYPHLAFYNQEEECGVGAVVPWAGRLWVVTYAPHKPFGSTDKLYEITPDFQLSIRPESIGGTPANRMIHRETNQLIVGPYVISASGTVRVIPYEQMPGRPTGNARHLVDPKNKLYFATMEEGLYEVDLHTLQVAEIFADGNRRDRVDPSGSEKSNFAGARLPGYHGKGVYSGQGCLIYANNGDESPQARLDPATPSGALASWRPDEDHYTLILRKQFTEVTGPGGVYGNGDPDRDPVWSLGWDDKSLLLALLENGTWSYFRLPKASHSYDGAHGWHTEWPRIREIGQGDRLLATMHGTFWSFPVTFSLENTAGLRPRSNYLKVIGDFCRWNDRIVFGCDDSAAQEFVNKRPQKNSQGSTGQSNSNLWFVSPDQIEKLGPSLGRGCLWKREDAAKGAVSEPYLFAGYNQRILHLSHSSTQPVPIQIDIDVKGNSQWAKLETLTIPANSSLSYPFDEKTQGEWIRMTVGAEAKNLTASLLYGGNEYRDDQPALKFEGLAKGDSPDRLDGVLWSTGGDRRTLAIATPDSHGRSLYELTQDAVLKPAEAPEILARTMECIQKENIIQELPSAWLWVEKEKRYLFPKNPIPAGSHRSCVARVIREVVTERDLLQIDGSFYELPSVTAGGVAFVRPVSTHGYAIDDFCSYAGLFVMTGLDQSALTAPNEHIIRSTDGKTAVWAGAIDDLWDFGKPRGVGGPWKETDVIANQPSDPYLMTGYDQKSVILSHRSDHAIDITLEIDIDGSGNWIPYRQFTIAPGETVEHQFPAGFAAYWTRAICNENTKATALFSYK